MTGWSSINDDTESVQVTKQYASIFKYFQERLLQVSITVRDDYIGIDFPQKYDLKAAIEMVNKIAEVCSISEKKLNRFFDLSKNEKIELEYKHMSSLTVSIKHLKGDARDTKSAFGVKNDILFGFGPMFQTMVADQGTHAGIFYNEEDAIAWLKE